MDNLKEILNHNQWIIDVRYFIKDRRFEIDLTENPESNCREKTIKFENVMDFKIEYSNDFEEDYNSIFLGLIWDEKSEFILTSDSFEIVLCTYSSPLINGE